MVTLETDRPSRRSVQCPVTPQTGCPYAQWLQEDAGGDRADWGSHGQGFLVPTFHIEGLELGQVPNGTWEICQLILFQVQYLRKEKTMRPILPG